MKADRAVFEGRVRDRHETVCKCHGKPVYVDPRDYYAGVPSCPVSRQAVGPEDIETRPLPDLVWSKEQGKMVEEAP